MGGLKQEAYQALKRFVGLVEVVFVFPGDSIAIYLGKHYFYRNVKTGGKCKIMQS